MEKSFYDGVLLSLIKIMRDRNLTQAAMAEYMGVSPSHFGKVVRGEVKMSFVQMSNLASNLSMSEIDLMTYPDKYIRVGKAEDDPVKAVLQIELKKDKKDQVLKLLFGEHNIEILNK
jgi:transcriptional regulator with XRE-family HTH domain